MVRTYSDKLQKKVESRIKKDFPNIVADALVLANSVISTDSSYPINYLPTFKLHYLGPRGPLLANEIARGLRFYKEGELYTADEIWGKALAEKTTQTLLDSIDEKPWSVCVIKKPDQSITIGKDKITVYSKPFPGKLEVPTDIMINIQRLLRRYHTPRVNAKEKTELILQLKTAMAELKYCPAKYYLEALSYNLEAIRFIDEVPYQFRYLASTFNNLYRLFSHPANLAKGVSSKESHVVKAQSMHIHIADLQHYVDSCYASITNIYSDGTNPIYDLLPQKEEIEFFQNYHQAYLKFLAY